MFNDTTTNTHGEQSARASGTKTDDVDKVEVPRVRYEDDDAGCVDVSSDVHQSKQAPKEIRHHGDAMKVVIRRALAACFAVVTGAFMVVFLVEQRRWKRRRDEHAEHLSTLLGTVYPHGHDGKKNF